MPVDSIKGKKKKQEQVKKNSVKSTKWIGTYSPDSCCTVYAKNHNLYLFFIEDSVEIQLTTDGVPNYSYAGKNRDTTGKMVTANVEWMADSKHFYVIKYNKIKW